MHHSWYAYEWIRIRNWNFRASLQFEVWLAAWNGAAASAWVEIGETLLGLLPMLALQLVINTLLTFWWCIDGFVVVVNDGEAVTPMMEPATPGMEVKLQQLSILDQISCHWVKHESDTVHGDENASLSMILNGFVEVGEVEEAAERRQRNLQRRQNQMETEVTLVSSSPIYDECSSSRWLTVLDLKGKAPPPTEDLLVAYQGSHMRRSTWSIFLDQFHCFWNMVSTPWDVS